MTIPLQYPGKYFFYHTQNYYVVNSVGIFIVTVWHHTFPKSLEGYSISSQSIGVWTKVILLKYYHYTTENSAAPAKLSYHKTPLTFVTKNKIALIMERWEALSVHLKLFWANPKLEDSSIMTIYDFNSWNTGRGLALKWFQLPEEDIIHFHLPS